LQLKELPIKKYLHGVQKAEGRRLRAEGNPPLLILGWLQGCIATFSPCSLGIIFV
jgi:hypothetical protein